MNKYIIDSRIAKNMEKHPFIFEQSLNKKQKEKYRLLLDFMEWVIKEEGMTTNGKKTHPALFVHDYIKQRRDIEKWINEHNKKHLKKYFGWNIYEVVFISILALTAIVSIIIYIYG